MLEGVRQNDHLDFFPQRVQKVFSTWQGTKVPDDLLDIRKLQTVLIQDREPTLHQFVVVRFIPGGAPQFRNAGFFGHGDPDFRRQNAFHIQGYNRLSCLLH